MSQTGLLGRFTAWLGCKVAGHLWFRECCQNCGLQQEGGPVGIDYAVREQMRRDGWQV